MPRQPDPCLEGTICLPSRLKKCKDIAYDSDHGKVGGKAVLYGLYDDGASDKGAP